MKPTKKQLEAIQEIEKKVAEVCDTQIEREIEVSLSYGYDAPSLKTQIKEQGFEVDMKLIVESELIKNQILSLEAIGILSKKQTYRAFRKLNDHIGETIADSLCNENQTAIKVK